MNRREFCRTERKHNTAHRPDPVVPALASERARVRAAMRAARGVALSSASLLPLRRCGVSAPRSRASRVHGVARASAADSGALRARLAAAESERATAEASALSALAAAKAAGASAEAANREAEAAVIAGDDAAASAALASRREAREALAAALRRADTANALRAKLQQLVASLETDVIAAEAASRPAPPPPPPKPLRPASALSDEELSERFIALSSATPVRHG
jgi:hypothetical protein